MSGLGMGYGFFGWLMMLLFLVLIIGAVVLGIRWFMNEGKLEVSRKDETPLDIVKKR